MQISIPYGKTALHAELEDALVRAVLTPRPFPKVDLSPEGQAETVRRAVLSPIGTAPLQELALGKRNAVIILSDHTRPVPSKLILPVLLRELRAKNPSIEITLLIATGFHRQTTKDELRAKLGDLLDTERVVVHNSADAASNVELGTLPSGATLKLNRLAAETDLLLSEGFIEPHFFAGYSGGRKSVLPGVCDRVTVLGNHCAKFIADPHARTGVLEGNPIHRDMCAAAKMAKLAFIANVVLDEEKNVAAAFAGDPFEAHAAGCAFLSRYCGTEAAPAKIVISSNGGAPLDQNVYQSVKGMTAAEATAAEGGVIILCAECADGVGSDDMYEKARDCASPRALREAVERIPMEATEPDQWQYQIFARVLERFPVIFVTRPALRETVEQMKLHYAASLPEALALARSMVGERESITVIPNGVSVIVKEAQ